MRKHFHLLAAALGAGALLAGTATQQAPPASLKQVDNGEAAVARVKSQASKPMPQKPAEKPVAHQRTVKMRPQPMGYGFMPIFRELPQRRRVKYGNRRWVVLG